MKKTKETKTPTKKVKKETKSTAKTKAKTTAKDTQATSPIGKNSTILLTIPKDKVKTTYDKVLVKMAKQVKTDGFRKGKVPTHIAEGKIGQIKIIEGVLDKLVPDIYIEAIKKSKKQPISRPEFNPKKLTMGEDWEVEAIFAELPEIKLGKYQTIVKKSRKEAEVEIKKAKDLKEEQKKEMALQHIFRGLATEMKPKIPELLLKQDTQREFEDIKKNLSQMNLSVDDYLKKRGMTFDDLSNELAISVLGRLQLDFILGAIAKEQKFEATDKDVDDFIAKIEDKTTREAVATNASYKQQLNLTIIRQKVVDYLYNM